MRAAGGCSAPQHGTPPVPPPAAPPPLTRDERLAVAGLELLKARAVQHAPQQRAHVPRLRARGWRGQAPLGCSTRAGRLPRRGARLLLYAEAKPLPSPGLPSPPNPCPPRLAVGGHDAAQLLCRVQRLVPGGRQRRWGCGRALPPVSQHAQGAAAMLGSGRRAANAAYSQHALFRARTRGGRPAAGPQRGHDVAGYRQRVALVLREVVRHAWRPGGVGWGVGAGRSW